MESGGTYVVICYYFCNQECITFSHLPRKSSHSYQTDAGAMQDVAYQEQEAVPDTTEDDIIIPVEGATIENEDQVLEVENPPLDVRRNPPRNRHPPLCYGDLLITCLVSLSLPVPEHS